MAIRSVDFDVNIESDSASTNGVVACTNVHSVAVNYTILDDDNIGTVRVTDTTSARTITLPTVADNSSRIIKIINDGLESGEKVIVEGEGAETIDGLLNINIPFYQDDVTVQSNGTSWHVIGEHPKQFIKVPDASASPNFYKIEALGAASQQFAGHEPESNEFGSGTDLAVYKFDSSNILTDETGNYTLTNNNAVTNTTGVMGKSQGANFVGGSSQYFTQATLFDTMPSISYTIDFWYKPVDGQPSIGEVLFSKENSTGPNNNMWFNLGTNGVLDWNITVAGSHSALLASMVLPNGANDWRHIFLSHDNWYGMRMWINGVLQGSIGSAVTFPGNGTSSDFYLGAYWAPSSYISGQMSYFRVTTGERASQRMVDLAYSSKYNRPSDFTNNADFDISAFAREKGSSDYEAQVPWSGLEVARRTNHIYRYGGIFDEDDYIKLIGKVR